MQINFHSQTAFSTPVSDIIAKNTTTLPSTPYEQGRFVFVTSDKTLYASDGTKFINIMVDTKQDTIYCNLHTTTQTSDMDKLYDALNQMNRGDRISGYLHIDQSQSMPEEETNVYLQGIDMVCSGTSDTQYGKKIFFKGFQLFRNDSGTVQYPAGDWDPGIVFDMTMETYRQYSGMGSINQLDIQSVGFDFTKQSPTNSYQLFRHLGSGVSKTGQFTITYLNGAPQSLQNP